MFVIGPPQISPESLRWQLGYCHGEQRQMPLFPDDTNYASGWCHGHNHAHQCSMMESEAIFFRLGLQVRIVSNEFPREAVAGSRDP